MVVTLLNRIFLENFDEVGIKTISGSIIRICLKSNILFMKMFLTFHPQLFLSLDELFYKLLTRLSTPSCTWIMSLVRAALSPILLTDVTLNLYCRPGRQGTLRVLSLV